LTERLLFIDEDFPIDTAKALREHGFIVVATVETGIRGLPDLDQLRRAAEMNAVFVSNNSTERHRFAGYARELQQAGFSDVAAVLLPHEPPGRRLLLRTAMLVTWHSQLPVPHPSVVFWNHLAQRLIQGERVPGFTENDVQIVMDWNRPHRM
jgi:Domain of unknown function (DUF5615)